MLFHDVYEGLAELFGIEVIVQSMGGKSADITNEKGLSWGQYM